MIDGHRLRDDPFYADGFEGEALMACGVLAKLTHGSTIRLAPPLVITADQLHFVIDQLAEAFAAMA